MLPLNVYFEGLTSQCKHCWTDIYLICIFTLIACLFILLSTLWFKIYFVYMSWCMYNAMFMSICVYVWQVLYNVIDRNSYTCTWQNCKAVTKMCMCLSRLSYIWYVIYCSIINTSRYSFGVIVFCDWHIHLHYFICWIFFCGDSNVIQLWIIEPCRLSFNWEKKLNYWLYVIRILPFFLHTAIIASDKMRMITVDSARSPPRTGIIYDWYASSNYAMHKFQAQCNF